MSTIEQNLQAVRDSIAQAAADAQRAPADVTLLAVSKTFGADAVLAAMRAGQAAFGENYLQEALDKIAFVKEAAPQQAPAWHFIGPIQSNKTRPIAEHFDWVHTVEREKIAARLSEQRPAGLPDLNICLQVNISGEASKSGVTPAELPALACAVAQLPRLRLRGLMTIPEPETELQLQRAAFAQLRALYEQLNAEGLALDTLSMGMSADLRAAVLEGATIVRVGSAIFGSRNYS
ncbi:YggS family pyridoxal phosphate-dependent enzyme [Janthinobacterium sp. PLB04]|uniref:Pyridoxal phosphate homeostasis protein n=1 Tax=Janthinobacterium lividum TaxID=29581 RepID=A0AAJ4MUF5_9BURK|nr:MULTISPECIES: YggS family pyridoxal phosphate-dependent enzyme [Janthinobacterium]KAB0331172.1 YggS family pyridoxal phosphate-dependent enzyme [Janthinobacterium lividum]QSX97366.1 YggS family pyridoxal phosphate-dependent enzyme [Janthinobacterium lividum]UGQ37296.1 YggS family pyridoxal phosphate-dependent enzyme [Janthinobacterium sp. PLB04]